MEKFSLSFSMRLDVANVPDDIMQTLPAGDADTVLAMMPHPERAADPNLGNTDGRLIFESILNSVEVA